MPANTPRIAVTSRLVLTAGLLGAAASGCGSDTTAPHESGDASSGSGGTAGRSTGSGGAGGRAGASGNAGGSTAGQTSGGAGGTTGTTGGASGAAGRAGGASSIPDAGPPDAGAPSSEGGREPDSGGLAPDAHTCALSLVPPALPAAIQAPSDARPVHHFHAVGTQHYACVSSSEPDGGTTYGWGPPTPDATLFDGCGTPVATHFAGPTWRSISDHSTVTGMVVASSPSASAIPWLLLRTLTTAASGLFANVGLIQRTNTTGGVPPADDCTAGDAGATVTVPYTADYYFYAASCAAIATTPERVVVLADGSATPMPCEFMLPPPGDTLGPYPRNVNVAYTANRGTPFTTLGYVPSAAACGSTAPGWYFDDPNLPRTISLCASACNALTSASNPAIEVRFGCPRAELPLP